MMAIPFGVRQNACSILGAKETQVGRLANARGKQLHDELIHGRVADANIVLQALGDEVEKVRHVQADV